MHDARFGWLVSYPKSGNTWMRLSLESLIQGGQAIDITAREMRTPIASREEFDQLFGIDSGILTEREIDAVRPQLHRLAVQEFDGPLMLRKVHDRCWKTLAGERVFPPELSLGAVYVVRDPRDVAVSAAHFYGTDFDVSIERMGDSERTLARNEKRYSSQLPQPLGTWSEHVVSWIDDAGMPVHLVRYEDLKKDAAGELRRVAAFLNLPAENVELAAAATDFRALQRQEAENGFAKKPRSCRQFFREGRAEGWRDVLSAAQCDRILNDHGAVMSRFGYV